jgi:Ca-activated chloride channel homolog
MTGRKLYAFVCLGLLCQPLAFSQAAPPQAPPTPPVAERGQEPNFTFKSAVNLVTFTATITDSTGRYASGLIKENVGVFEDGVRQQLAMFKFEPEPVSVGIVFDTSGSMRTKIQDVADAVAHFGATALPDDDIFLMQFAGRAKIVMEFTNDRDRLASAANDLRAGGATVLYDAVSEALDHVLKGRNRRQALVVITDGEDTSSATKLDYLLQQAKESEVLVYCIGIGEVSAHNERGGSRPSLKASLPAIILGGRNRFPQTGRNPGGGQDTVDMFVLNSLAEVTGGRAWQIRPNAGGRVDDIDRVTQEISAELRQQYFLGYYPSNPAHDGTYRRIQVTTTNPDLTVRTRRGYYAPKN